MPNISTALTINNGAAAAKTFSIQRINPEKSIFEEKTAAASGNPAGYTRLTVASSAASKQRASYKVHVDVDLPVLVTSDGIETVARTLLFRGEFTIPATSSQTERDNLAAYVINALSHASVKPTFQNLDPMY
jgi:hypothetical protein